MVSFYIAMLVYQRVNFPMNAMSLGVSILVLLIASGTKSRWSPIFFWPKWAECTSVRWWSVLRNPPRKSVRHNMTQPNKIVLKCTDNQKNSFFKCTISKQMNKVIYHAMGILNTLQRNFPTQPAHHGRSCCENAHCSQVGQPGHGPDLREKNREKVDKSCKYWSWSV